MSNLRECGLCQIATSNLRRATGDSSAETTCVEHATVPTSCGETTVYLLGWALQATCVDGVITDTFVQGFPCPHH